MTHAFLSYVTEDEGCIDYVDALLRENEIEVWRDKSDLIPGLTWRSQLHAAIQQGAYFVPFFSPAWAGKNRTVANEEVLWAIDELKLRPQDRAWLVPFVLPGGEVPPFEISPGRYLSDIQNISVDRLGWAEAMKRLLNSLGVAQPELQSGEPLAPNLPGALDLVNGHTWVDEIEPDLPVFRGLVIHFREGSIWRDEHGLIAQLRAHAPNKELEEFNRSLGLNLITCRSPDVTLSYNSSRPTIFASSRVITMRRGDIIPAMLGTEAVELLEDMRIEIEWTASAAVEANQIKGSFQGTTRLPMLSFHQQGGYEIEWRGRTGPPPGSVKPRPVIAM